MAPFMPTAPPVSLLPAEGRHTFTHPCRIPGNSTKPQTYSPPRTQRPATSASSNQQFQAGEGPHWNATGVGWKEISPRIEARHPWADSFLRQTR